MKQTTAQEEEQDKPSCHNPPRGTHQSETEEYQEPREWHLSEAKEYHTNIISWQHISLQQPGLDQSQHLEYHHLMLLGTDTMRQTRSHLN